MTVRRPRLRTDGLVTEAVVGGVLVFLLAPVIVVVLASFDGGDPVAGRASLTFPPTSLSLQWYPASCITFLSEQAFAPQNTRFWSRRRVWFQFTVGEDKPPILSVDNRGKGVLSMDCSAKRSPL